MLAFFWTAVLFSILKKEKIKAQKLLNLALAKWNVSIVFCDF